MIMKMENIYLFLSITVYSLIFILFAKSPNFKGLLFVISLAGTIFGLLSQKNSEKNARVFHFAFLINITSLFALFVILLLGGFFGFDLI
ncbi:MAG: hypothetical protein A3D57_05565 [Candidatus Sungbacteria bacterium RIFCSPHIGHO2_02_FULL_46_12]|nr:MAG: hypothetical protein A3D57_05565 [Candidatus Sungbacteria bacterium RIFCSPHIGHO2_02_FULL_46_12]